MEHNLGRKSHLLPNSVQTAFYDQKMNCSQLTDGALLLQLQLMMPEILTWSLKLDGIQTAITQLSLFSKPPSGQFKGIALIKPFLANP